MANTPQYVDISSFQPLDINWVAYRQWAASFDGVARVAIKSSEGTGYTDPHFQTYRDGAIKAGVDVIIYYHYARPEWNSPIAEADWQHQVVGSIRSQDVLMLDYEGNVSQSTAEWAYEWLTRQETNYGGKLPIIYSYESFINQKLQDSRLARYPLVYALWQYTPTERPPCPSPWQHYTYLQYSDKATNIPGIPGSVDANIYLGVETMEVPINWHDDPTTQTLTAPNGIPVRLGFRLYILTHPWDSANVPTTAEYHLDNLEEFNPTIGAGQKQVFLYGNALEYTLTRGVFPAWNGKEFDFIVHEKAQLASQVQTLEQQLQSYQAQAQLLATVKQKVTTLETDVNALKATVGV